MDRKQLEKEFGHLDCFDQAMEVLDRLENGEYTFEVVDFTGDFPELKQGTLEKQK